MGLQRNYISTLDVVRQSFFQRDTNQMCFFTDTPPAPEAGGAEVQGFTFLPSGIDYYLFAISFGWAMV
jgi:hypothetical protein